MVQQNILTTSMVAERLGCSPQAISRMFYNGTLRCDICPLVGGRRLIPVAYVPLIAIELERAGKLPRSQVR